MPRNDEAVSVLPYGTSLYYSYKQPFVLATDTRPHVRYVTHSPIYQYDYYTDQGPSEEEQRTKLTMLAANGLAVSSEVDVDVSSTFEAVHQKRALFTGGRYVPLSAAGAEGDSVVAFARIAGADAAIVVVPRLVADLVGDRTAPTGGTVWGDARLELPPELADRRWQCALSGRLMSSSVERRGLPLGEILASLPVALLIGDAR